jgi:hypothetical protein
MLIVGRAGSRGQSFDTGPFVVQSTTAVVAVAGLVAEDVQPVLEGVLPADPGAPLGVHRDDTGVLAAEDPPADRLPALLVLADVPAVAAQDPHDVVGSVARGHVSGEQDGLRLGQVVAGAQLPALSGRQGPQQDRRGHEAVRVDPVDLAVEALEERRADPDAARSLEGQVPGRVGRGAPPLRRHELDRGVPRLRAMGEVGFPLLVGRLEGTVPGCAGGPEERRAVRVGEVVRPF